ncbi:sensor histidine kinase [Sporobacter termitidis]|nr:sensor histidine kinase [Sporobacter termitidis]
MIFAHTSSVRARSFSEGAVWQAVVVKLTEYIAAYILAIFLNKRNDVYLPSLLRFRITLVPIVSLCAIIIFLHFNIGVQKTIVLIMIILIINIAVLLLYVEISAEYADKYQHLIIKKQNEYYVHQFELMNESIKLRNAEKHDFKNHLSVISALMQKNEQEEAAGYIDKIIDVYKSVREPHNSGNLVIDSILNYKTQEAAQHDIKINVGLSIPENLQVNSFDMTTILGNILDNAINAAKKLQKDKFIDLKIRYDKGRLLIKIDNPFNGEIKYENNKLVTLHPDTEDHGIGLNNVRTVLEKYDGTLEIEHTDNLFSASLMLFV